MRGGKIVLVSWGLAGPHADGVCENGRDTYSCSGWRSDPATWSDVPDGTPVVYSGCVLEDYPGFAYASPLVDARLRDDERSDCPDLAQSVVAQAILASGQGFAPYVDMHQRARALLPPSEPGPLDSVSVAGYVRWWRQRGAVIGTYRGGRVEWPAGTPRERLPYRYDGVPWDLPAAPVEPEPTQRELL